MSEIEHEKQTDRQYIPLGERYEIQTRGSGSSYRILDKETGHRELIMDECTHDFLTEMGTNLLLEHEELKERLAELEDGLRAIKDHQVAVGGKGIERLSTTWHIANKFFGGQ